MKALHPRIRQFLLEVLTDNLAFKVLSLCLAAGIWVGVQNEDVTDHRVRARIQYTWPEGLTRAEDAVSTLSVSISGPHGLVRLAEKRELILPVDLSEAEAGSVTVDFTDRPILGLPAGLDVVQRSPPSVEIVLDKITTRPLKVKPVLKGDPAPGWQLVSVTTEPKLVDISGPLTVVQGMSEIGTNTINISGINADLDVEIGLAVRGRTLTPRSRNPVKVHIDVEPIFTERAFPAVPVLVRTPGWKVEPATAALVLRGTKRDLEALKPDEVNVVVSLPEPLPPPAAEGVAPGLDLSWSAESRTVRVIHTGSAEAIQVGELSPITFHVEPLP
jgi:YbbR domain-containing protein